MRVWKNAWTLMSKLVDAWKIWAFVKHGRRTLFGWVNKQGIVIPGAL